MNIKKHYQNFFAINDMGIGEDDKLNIEWAESLLEEYKAEKAKTEPTHEEFLEYQKEATTAIVELYSKIEIISPKSKKDGFTKERFTTLIFEAGLGAAINFLLEHKKQNDKEFAEAIKTSDAEIQEMIDEALEKHKPKN